MIKMNMARAFVALLLVTGYGTVHATGIIDTWESTITSTTNTALNIGDIVTWTVTYNDAFLVAHFYDDGPNKIAEGGGGGDVLTDEYCTGTAIGGADCTYNNINYSLLTDAIIDISVFYNPIIAAGFVSWNPLTHTNYSFVSSFNNISGCDVQLRSNDISFIANPIDNNPNFSTITMWYSYVNPIGDTIFDRNIMHFNSRLLSSTSVPEPGSICLLGLGLLSLSFFQRRNKWSRTP